MTSKLPFATSQDCITRTRRDYPTPAILASFGRRVRRTRHCQIQIRGRLMIDLCVWKNIKSTNTRSQHIRKTNLLHTAIPLLDFVTRRIQALGTISRGILSCHTSGVIRCRQRRKLVCYRSKHHADHIHRQRPMAHGLPVLMSEHPATKQTNCPFKVDAWNPQTGTDHCIYCLSSETDTNRCPGCEALACSACLRLIVTADKTGAGIARPTTWYRPAGG